MLIAPFNALFIPFIPFYFTRYREAVDDFLCKVSYIPWALIGGIIFFFINIAYSIFVYAYAMYFLIIYSPYTRLRSILYTLI